MEAPLGRIITAMVTPFGPDGDLDLDAARALARHLVANGSEGLVLAGTTGEGTTVNDVERVQLIEAVVDEVGDRASVIATTGTYDTRHSVHLTREARAAGADAFLVVTPYYSKPPAEGIYRHFRADRRRRGRPADRASTTSRSGSSSTCRPSCCCASPRSTT